MRVLIACEFSGIVRDAFLRHGIEAISCDLLDNESDRGEHIKGNVIDILNDGWDMMIAHPPCTHLATSGARWFKNKTKEQELALEFVRILLNADIKYIAVENPVSIISTRIRKPDQIIQPWQFGHSENKKTCLWLKNLPKLEPTDIVNERNNTIYMEPPSKDRWKNRSRTFTGIADAMAKQWGKVLMEKSIK